MSDKKNIFLDGYQPQEGCQSTLSPKPPEGDKVQSGYKPTTSEAKPASNPPPKRP